MTFAQLLDFLPRHELRNCVARYCGHYKVKGFSSWDQFLCSAFAQLTYRKRLRDIEVCLRFIPKKTGVKHTVSGVGIEMNYI